jgi:hypothetical protein
MKPSESNIDRADERTIATVVVVVVLLMRHFGRPMLRCQRKVHEQQEFTFTTNATHWKLNGENVFNVGCGLLAGKGRRCCSSPWYSCTGL